MKLKPIYHLGLFLLIFVAFHSIPSMAWHDETHIAVAKVAGYDKWYNAAGADMVKVKAHDIEGHNHYVNIPPGLSVTPEMVLAQAEKYDQVDEDGHLYGAIIASLRKYIREKARGKYGEYHLAFCAHYIGDLSQPLHNTPRNLFNLKYHVEIDGIVNDEILDNLAGIRIYPIKIDSEIDLAKEISRIANISLSLGREIESQDRPLTREEAYTQLGHSASLLRAVLRYSDEQGF